MGVIANRFYNDPAMAQAANNLAQLFAPPSGSDMAGFANARAKEQEAARLAEVFAYAKDPNYDRGLAEREAIAAGVYNPTQSFYAVDQGNATTRYGYDKSLEGTRYTADTAAATQRANNAADNTRALTVAEEQALLTPVAKDATRFVPPTISKMYDVPATQTGVVGAAPGETLTMPDGSVVKGEPKPLTLDEWTAQQAAAAKASGLISDQDIADAVNGKETPIQVLVNGKMEWMTPGEATRIGASPVPSMDSTKALAADKLNLGPDELKRLVLGDKPAEPQVDQGTAIVNGAKVPVYFDPDRRQWIMPNQQPIPANAQVTQMASGTEPTPAKAELGTALLQNGQSVPVWFDESDAKRKVWRTQNGQEIPPTAQVTKMGAPQGALGDITTGASTSIQKSLADIAIAKGTAIQLRDLIAKAPASQGVVGWLRGSAQDAAQVVGEVGNYFGGDLKKAIDDTKASIAAKAAAQGEPGVANDLLSNFDENIPAVELLSNLLAYQFAAINGDRLSNETVKLNRQALGLENMTANQKSTTIKLNAAIKALEDQERTYNDLLTKGPGAVQSATPPPAPGDITQGAGASTTVPAPAAAAPAAAAPAAAAPAVKRIQYDANGRRITK